MCIVRWSYSSPVTCDGLVRMKGKKGYYYDGNDWVRDDEYVHRAYDNYKFDCDWMDIGDADGFTAEEELEAAKASIRRRVERTQKGEDITTEDVRAETDRYGLGTLKLIKEDSNHKYFIAEKDIGMEKVNQYRYPKIVKASKKYGEVYFLDYYDVCRILVIEPFAHSGEGRRCWLAKYTAAEDGSILECSSYVRVESFDDGDDCFEYESDGWHYMFDKTLASYADHVMIDDDQMEFFRARKRTLGLTDNSEGGIRSHSNIGPRFDDTSEAKEE